MLSVVVTTQRANHNAATGSSDNPVTELCQSWNQRAPLLFIPRAEHNWVFRPYLSSMEFRQSSLFEP